MKNYFKYAFTLAEVLITLVIIGVVAAITVPTLQANYLERERVARVKKTYSILNQAMIRVRATGADMMFEEIDGNSQKIKEWYDEYLGPFLITTKVCYQKAGCWNEGDTKWLNGSTHSYNKTGVGLGSDIITAVLNDGTLINIDGFSVADMDKLFGIDAEGTAGFVVYFDINGVKKPNTIGKDIFCAVYSADIGFVPAYAHRKMPQIDSDCSSTGKGTSCIIKYLNKA